MGVGPANQSVAKSPMVMVAADGKSTFCFPNPMVMGKSRVCVVRLMTNVPTYRPVGERRPGIEANEAGGLFLSFM